MEEYLRIYFSIAWFCILLNFLVLITSVVVHEFGHLVFGYLENCKAKIIIFSTIDFSTHTELECTTQPSILLTLGGLIFTLIFSLMFLFLDLPENNYSLIVLGLSFLLATYDLMELGLSVWVSILVGVALIIFGEYKYIQEKLALIEERKFFVF